MLTSTASGRPATINTAKNSTIPPHGTVPNWCSVKRAPSTINSDEINRIVTLSLNSITWCMFTRR